jgi:hypothetical protein
MCFVDIYYVSCEGGMIMDMRAEPLKQKTSDVLRKKKKKQALLKDKVWKYSEEEDTIDYVLFIIREGTGRLI